MHYLTRLYVCLFKILFLERFTFCLFGSKWSFFPSFPTCDPFQCIWTHAHQNPQYCMVWGKWTVEIMFITSIILSLVWGTPEKHWVFSIICGVFNSFISLQDYCLNLKEVEGTFPPRHHFHPRLDCRLAHDQSLSLHSCKKRSRNRWRLRCQGWMSEWIK